jgi:hypothetical protein
MSTVAYDDARIRGWIALIFASVFVGILAFTVVLRTVTEITLPRAKRRKP